jgi:NAD(P)-dependent dehydrogenase (short-subunit alcohol dehydrogenase family)
LIHWYSHSASKWPALLPSFLLLVLYPQVGEAKLISPTDANQGLGIYIAQLIFQSSKPYNILVGARNPSRGREAVARLEATRVNNESTTSTIEVNITSSESIVGAVEEVSNAYGRVDILVSIAAIQSKELGKTLNSVEDWKAVFDTKVIGTVAMTNAFVPLLQKSSDAKIVVLSSSMGSIAIAEASPPHPMSDMASPCRASKAAINMVLV